MTDLLKNIELYPMDSDGYAHSFPCDWFLPSKKVDPDQKDWYNVIKKYNLLVVQVLDSDECDILEKDIWKSVGPKVTSDPNTWANENWPNPKHPSLCDQYVYSEQAFICRTNPKLVKIFEILYGTTDLITTIDYYGIKRATLFSTGERKDWRNKPLKLHWDCDVKQYVEDQKENKFRYQALIAVNNNCQNTGSFSCVPGSANMLNEWLKLYEPESKKYVPLNNIWQNHIQRIPLRKGCVIIWDTGVAHANFSNYSTIPRLTMYCRMIPKQIWAIDKERQAIIKYWKENPDIKKLVISMRSWDDRQKKIMGL